MICKQLRINIVSNSLRAEIPFFNVFFFSVLYPCCLPATGAVMPKWSILGVLSSGLVWSSLPLDLRQAPGVTGFPGFCCKAHKYDKSFVYLDSDTDSRLLSFKHKTGMHCRTKLRCIQHMM